MLKINEIFYSIQGEGVFAGTPMVFIRFSGCNLRCSFCDTKHESFISMKEEEILEFIEKLIPPLPLSRPERVCLTGGEPFIQNFLELADLLVGANFQIHIETNGMLYTPKPWWLTWISVSPKAPLKDYSFASEIKWLIGKGFEWYEEEIQKVPFHVEQRLQPIWDEDYEKNLKTAIEKVKLHPKLCLSVQLQRYLKIR